VAGDVHHRPRATDPGDLTTQPPRRDQGPKWKTRPDRQSTHARTQNHTQEAPSDATRKPTGGSRLNLNYVGDENLLSHPYAFPANGVLTGLPPTLVITADLDDLRPSGEAYAAALALAGVDVMSIREVGVTHGHLNETSSPGARLTVERMIAWLEHAALVGEVHPATLGALAASDGPTAIPVSTRPDEVAR